MKTFASLALLLSFGSWFFLGLTFMNLLSGHFDTRTCLTDCVRNYYFLSAGLGLSGLVLAGVPLFRSGFNPWYFLTVILTALPFAFVAGIFTIGTLGPLLH